MKKALSNLIGKKFSVYVGGEFERMTDFIGYMALLHNYADFFAYSRWEQRSFLERGIRDGISTIDANIYVKIGK